MRRSSRVVRGGGWNNTTTNLRCANRNGNEPDNRNPNNGFRVASDLRHAARPDAPGPCRSRCQRPGGPRPGAPGSRREVGAEERRAAGGRVGAASKAHPRHLLYLACDSARCQPPRSRPISDMRIVACSCCRVVSHPKP
ncbi:MAG: SUMF1/EgtB/PvdO family nonheme iron enzyme [Planctomycetota bacterium]